ncbi:hypothetical protein BASA61_007468 [Batrachochytrium salamandrivorans]|nr:hypothetical protein BASA61_007468 [Batrachochytrium salamandrivorans]
MHLPKSTLDRLLHVEYFSMIQCMLHLSDVASRACSWSCSSSIRSTFMTSAPSYQTISPHCRPPRQDILRETSQDKACRTKEQKNAALKICIPFMCKSVAAIIFTTRRLMLQPLKSPQPTAWLCGISSALIKTHTATPTSPTSIPNTESIYLPHNPTLQDWNASSLLMFRFGWRRHRRMSETIYP